MNRTQLNNNIYNKRIYNDNNKLIMTTTLLNIALMGDFT